MTLTIDKRYDIVFLTRHLMGLKLGEKASTNAVKCAKSTVQYWFKQWKESKDLSDMKLSGGLRSTTEKVFQSLKTAAVLQQSVIYKMFRRGKTPRDNSTKVERSWSQVHSTNIKPTFDRKSSI